MTDKSTQYNLTKLTKKQIKFVEGLKQGLKAIDAYKEAGYTYKNEQVAKVSSSKLLHNERIMVQIAKFRDKQLARKLKIVEDVDVTEDWIINKYVQTIEDAQFNKQYNAVRGCLQDLSKMLGFTFDKKEVKVSGEVNQLHSVNATDLINAYRNANNTKIIDAESQEIK